MREKQILQLIEYIEKNSPAGGQSCADAVGCSLSTLKRELRKMEPEFRREGFMISGKTGRGNGYVLEISDAERFESYRQLLMESGGRENSPDLNSAADRIRFLVRTFLEEEEPVRLDDLADELLLSRAQLAKDMRTVRRFFRDYSLEIVSKPHHGSALSGDEMNFRACLTALLQNEINVDDEESVFLVPYSIPGMVEEIQPVLNSVIRYGGRQTYDLNDMTAQDLSACFYVTAKRISSGHIIEFPDQWKEELLHNRDYKLACGIAGDLEELFDIEFSQEEVCYLTLQLTAHQMGHKNQLTEETMQIVDEMLEEVYQRHHLDLRDSSSLRQFLGLHTVSLLQRLRFNVSLLNPFLNDIRMNYIVSYDIAATACRVLTRRYGYTISPDETAYYALHFKIASDRLKRSIRKKVLVVCSSGRGTAKMLESNLYSWFAGQLDSVETCNAFEVPGKDLTAYDCVFSTVPLKAGGAVPVIQISAFFDSSNVRIIENALSRRNMAEDGSVYFREELFFTGVEAYTKEEAISRMAEKIKAVCDVTEQFEKALLDKERLQDAQNGPVAFLRIYGLPQDSPVIAFALLDKPVRWGREQVQILILAACPNQFEKENELFYFFIRELMNSRHFARALIRSGSYDTLLDLYEEVIRKGNRAI